MKKILILLGNYLPGHKDGGPSRTIINVTDAFGDRYEFYIACLDREYGDEKPYSGIIRNEWNQVGKAKVWYVEPGQFSSKLLCRLANGMDVIYLCSFYEDYGYKTLWLKRKGKINCRVVLASMGVFSDAALKKKSLKKKIFIGMAKLLGLFNNIKWSVTSELEAEDVRRHIGDNIKFIVAEDLPRLEIPGRIDKSHSMFRVVFLSRICAHKNLDFAIRAISSMQNKVEFTIYGPIQEEDYWNDCKTLLSKSRIKWSYGGDVESEQVQGKLAEHDVLIFPSQSENFGHVVFEALSVGCIPLISDKTPWKDLDANGVGYEMPLDEYRFTEKLDELAQINSEELNGMSDRAVEYAKAKLKQSITNSGYRMIFDGETL